MAENKRLITLSKLFAPYATLYAVGGYVRDNVVGLPSSDLDICSKLSVEEVKKILLTSDFVISDKNLRMGTVVISARGFKAEYTTFRTDSYREGSGEHTPESVSFTEDISLDALRRDFKCNALYYDALTGEIIDLVGGKRDIERRIISTVDEPEKVFGADGLRVLRMVRFAAELGFDIDVDTLRAAKNNAWRVKDIAAERILAELDKIFVADTIYPSLGLKDAHVRGLKLLDELGLVEMLLPELNALKGLPQPTKWHLFDAYGHTIETFEASAPEVRWAALLHDIGKRKAMEKNGNMHDHAAIGAEMTGVITERLKFAKKRAKELQTLVLTHMYDMRKDTSESKLRWFIVEHQNVIEALAELKKADAYGSQHAVLETVRIEDTYDAMKADGTPFALRQLKVCGDDLIEMGVAPEKRGMLMYELWRDTVMNLNLNDREHALEYLKKKIENTKE